ncbi:snare associated Golgi protein-domain-containing protein [Obelidium mucronatum]|nr:snare associated Golgi protein-domain-containing protein [Obelidium mucronatum]
MTPRKNRLLPFIALIAISLILIALWKAGAVQTIKATIISMLEYIDKHKSFGSILFVFLFGVITCLLLPASLSTMAAGVIFKPVPLGVVLVLLGSQLGLVLSYVLGRTVLRPYVENYKKKSPFMKALDKALAREGFKIVLLIRFSPIVPFGIANYMFSVTSIPLPLLQLATLCGNIPGVEFPVLPYVNNDIMFQAITYTIIGSYIGSLSGISDGGGGSGGGGGDDDDNGSQLSPKTKALGVLVSGCVLIWTVVYIGVVARGALRLATVRNSGDDESTSTTVASLESGMVGGESESSPHVVERAPLMSNDERSARENGSSGNSIHRTDASPSQMSISDVSELADGPIDVNGYTAEDRLLIRRSFWGLIGVLGTGIISIIVFV